MQGEDMSAINHKRILDDLSHITTLIITGDPSRDIPGEPFYGHFFIGLIKKITPQTDTLAVGHDKGLITLYLNPTFWDQYLVELTYKIGAVKHEILHIVFKHIFRYKDFSHKTIFNIAADLVVNQYIRPDQLIQGAVLMEDFPELKLKEGQHVNYYYNMLLDLYQNNKDKDEDDDSDNVSWQNLKSLLQEENTNQKRHQFWQEIESLSNAERDIAESAVNQSLETTLSRIKTENFGKLPQGLQQYLKAFEHSLTPVVNWKRLLRLFANSSSRTRIKNTLRRPSKRYGSNPGIKVRKKQKILIALDTSGSIDKSELQEFFNEIYHIWKQGSEIFVVECDMKIHQSYYYSGKTPETVWGGGGTAFDAPIKYANQVYRPDALIYFTDGYGPAPAERCYCPVLWLLSKNGSQPEYLKNFSGRKIKMV